MILVLFQHCRIARIVGAMVLGASLCRASEPGSSAPIDLSMQQQKAILRTAYDAMRRDDVNGVIAALENNLDRSARAQHVDLQIASQLAAIGGYFYNEGDRVHALRTCGLAMAKIAAPRGRMRTTDEIAALLLAGEMYEHVLNDRAKAKQAYQAVLAIDPTLEQAAQRIARIDATQRSAATKQAANELLRQRAAQSKR